MAQALVNESGRLVVELHAALQDMDPARWNEAAVHALRLKIRVIQQKLAGLTAASWPRRKGTADLRGRLVSVGEALSTIPDEDSSFATARVRWMAFRRELVPRYEAARSALRSCEIHVPSLRPTNYQRSFFHALMATTTLGILAVLPNPTWGIAVTGAFLVWAWTMETARRHHAGLNGLLMKAFSHVAHPHETRRINSATWYVTALFAISLTRSPLICAIGIAVLGFGDPVAAIVGRKLGRVKLMHGRTLEGSLGFFGAGALASFLAACVFAPTVSWPLLLAMALAGALAGSLAELLSLRVDDNLSVAIAATLAAAGAAAVLGVAL